MAQGLPNREIKKKIKISDSRLSVLRANPLVQKQVEKYTKLNEDKYKKALDVFADNAADVAKEVVSMVSNPSVGAPTRLIAAKEVLDRTSTTSNTGKPQQDGQALVFEQLLRVTKTTQGDEGNEELQNFDTKEAFEDLQNDLAPAAEDDTSALIDVEPVSFTKQIEPGVDMPSIKDNGGSELEKFKQKLAGLMKH